MAQRYSDYSSGEYHKGDAPFQFPWWAIVIAFIAWWPMGFVLLLCNRLLRSSSSRRAREATAQQKRFAQQPADGVTPIYARGEPVQTAGKAGNSDLKNTVQKLTSSTVATVLFLLGALLVFVGVVSLGDPISYIVGQLLEGSSAWTYGIRDLMTSFAVMGGGAACMVAGIFTHTNARTRKKIENIVGDADHMYIRDIAAAIPCSEEKCRKHLENCIDKGVFGDDAYLDMRTGCLVVRGLAPQPEKPAPPAPQQEQTNAAPAQEQTDPYRPILDALRSANDAIPDDEMSEKIARLETVSARIFRQAQSNPEKMPQIRKFMDYYLPTALHLLRTYSELDSQGVEGENIRATKQRIEQVMDTLVVAFENQLDQLFQSDAMDVSADIAVMENMLRADGLAGGAESVVPDSPQVTPTPKLQL